MSETLTPAQKGWATRRAADAARERAYAICDELMDLYFARSVEHASEGRWIVVGAADPGTAFVLPKLMKVCEILGCKPEELFTDLDSRSGCETCGYGGGPLLNFRVQRQS